MYLNICCAEKLNNAKKVKSATVEAIYFQLWLSPAKKEQMLSILLCYSVRDVYGRDSSLKKRQDLDKEL